MIRRVPRRQDLLHGWPTGCTHRRVGVFLRREAEALGYHDQAIARLVKAGTWVRVRRGAYVYGADWDLLDRRGPAPACSAVPCCARRRRAPSSPTSQRRSSWAPPCGAWTSNGCPHHPARRPNGRKERGCTSTRAGSFRSTSQQSGPSRSRVHPAASSRPRRCVGRGELAVVANDFLHRDLADEAGLARLCHEMRQWPYTLTTDRVCGSPTRDRSPWASPGTATCAGARDSRRATPGADPRRQRSLLAESTWPGRS